MSKEIENIVVVDGSQGEGGGQIFRSTLTLSMCLGKPVRIKNIRSGRRKPGLLRQHLTCLRAAQTICDAMVEGDELGAGEITFVPGKVCSGHYRFSVGSAGSTTLVFQTIMLPLLLAEELSEVLLEGGTHNGMAPSYEFIQRCFLPVMKKMGCALEVSLGQYGFYPAGGGSWRVVITPASSIKELVLIERGSVVDQSALAISARIPAHVTDRELDHVHKNCFWPRESLTKQMVSSVGPGNLISLSLVMENITEVFDAVGERNVSAERVAGRAVRDMKRYLSSDAVVGEHLADQIVLPMALGTGGKFRTLKPSQHLLTNIDVIRQLTGASISLEEIAEDCWEVVVGESFQ